MATGQDKTQASGVWWNWYYKDALKTKSELPTFSIQGRKRFFGLMRAELTSSQLAQQRASCIVFFPRADHTVDNFATSLSSSFKTSVVLGRHQSNIHLLVTCDSIDEFDKKTQRIPSNVNVWGDVQGLIAQKFGMRPTLQVIHVADILGGNEQKRNYGQQTIVGTFLCIQQRVVKSPSFQPKLQTAALEHIKNCLDAIEHANYSVDKVCAPDVYASDVSQQELQTRHKKAWDTYVTECTLMLRDLGKEVPQELLLSQNKQANTSGRAAAQSPPPMQEKSAHQEKRVPKKQVPKKPAATVQKQAPNTKPTGAKQQQSPLAASTQRKQPTTAGTGRQTPKNLNRDGTLRSKL